MLDLSQVMLVEQRQLQRAALDQLLNLDGSERRDPLQAFLGLKVLADARRGEHATVADQDDLLQVKTLTQLADLRCDRGRIAGVAFEDLHRHRTTFRIGQQSEDDLQVATAFIARMPEACERAVAAFKVSGADVIKNQGTFGEVPFGESIFDALLPFEQPVEGAIKLGFLDCLVQPKHRSQRGGGRLWMESASGGQLGGGFEN